MRYAWESTSPDSLDRVSADSNRLPTTPVRVGVFDGTRMHDRPDRLVTEEPMEIRIDAPGTEARPLAVTMRTPGHDFELAVGLCLTEGIIDSVEDLAEVKYCVAPEAEQTYNVVTLTTRRPVAVPERQFASTASCGVCGKTSMDQLEVSCPALGAGPALSLAVAVRLPDRLRSWQTVFDATGALHAAGLATATGEITHVREDVGRHNAVDKLIGKSVLDDELPLSDAVLVVSGRVSFEIVQKAARAGITIIVAVSAPSSLAVATADRLGVTLVGFVRDGRANVYSGAQRVAAA